MVTATDTLPTRRNAPHTTIPNPNRIQWRLLERRGRRFRTLTMYPVVGETLHLRAARGLPSKSMAPVPEEIRHQD